MIDPMNLLTEQKIQALRSLVSAARKVTLAAHTHPDGDALGSTSALALYLQQLGKEVAVVLPDSPAPSLQFILPAQVTFLCQDKEAEKAAAHIQASDLIILLDCNAFSRTEGLQPLLSASKAPKVLIDHHLNPDTESFSLVFSTPDISSASELLYWILKDFSATLEMTALLAIGEALLAGMTTDTNNFANSVYPSTFRMASELIAMGVDRDALLQKIYQSYRENRVRIMGYMQNEGMHILEEEGAAYMILTKEIQQRFGILDGETEGLVNVPLTIGKVRLSILLKEDGDHFRVSIRSKKGTSAQRLAATYFHGGGHENASGGKLYIGADVDTPEQAPAYLEKVLKTFLR